MLQRVLESKHFMCLTGRGIPEVLEEVVELIEFKTVQSLMAMASRVVK